MILNEFFNLPQVFEKDMEEGTRERLSNLHDKIRKEKGLPDPKEYLKIAQQKKKEIADLKAQDKKDPGMEEGIFGSKPSPVLPVVDKIAKVASGLTPQNVEVGKQIIQNKASEITRMLSPQTKPGVDVIEQGVAEGFQPVVPVKSRSQGSVSPERQKDIDRDVKLLNKYREKGMSAGSAADRLAKFKHKHMEEQGVAEGHADQQRKIVKKNGKPVGEVGIDRESSPGNGQWYMKCYATGHDLVGYDSMEEALAELKHCIKQGVAEGGYNDYDNNRTGFGRDEDFRNRERNAGLETEQNNIQIAINGRPWKVVPGRGYADSREEREYLNNMRKWAEKKSATSGKKWTVSLTGANPTVNELSNEKLGQYKQAAALDAGAADKRGDYERGDKRFAGIIKATKKQFANDVKKHQPTNEASSTSSDAVERAILNRIMTQHTDLLMKFGPDKVMQAAEEVAYGVGDVDEIGTSDVSAYVNQVKQILGAQ
jgi:hypothetical protein